MPSSEVVGAYNEQIRAAAAACEGAKYAPFAEALGPALPRNGGGVPFDASTAGFGRFVREMVWHRARRAMPAAPSLDQLAQRRGRRVTHDGVHLTEASAAVLADVVAAALGPG